MADIIEEGIWPCTVISGEAGEDPSKPGVVKVRVVTKIDDGPSKGRTSTYEDEINARSAKYVSRSMRACGWKGTSVASFAADCAAWIKATGGKTTVEIKHIEINKGKRFDEWLAKGSVGSPPIWDKANSIGRGAQPLAKPTGAAMTDADEALRAALELDGAAPPIDEPPTKPMSEDDIPFCTIGRVSLGEIARVLR